MDDQRAPSADDSSELDAAGSDVVSGPVGSSNSLDHVRDAEQTQPCVDDGTVELPGPPSEMCRGQAEEMYQQIDVSDQRLSMVVDRSVDELALARSSELELETLAECDLEHLENVQVAIKVNS